MPLTPEIFRAKYPLIIGWIEQTLAAHIGRARRVADLNFSRLPAYFGRELLTSAKVVAVDRLPVPPLSRMGLTQFGDWERGEYAGITYLDTFFVTRGEVANEALHFHELVHVVQWRLLGPERFIAAYAAGLEAFGYRDSPLEATAYDLEEKFKTSLAVFDAAKAIASSLPAQT
jgi:hypothetical protein